jgi:hypothetical protein
MSAHTCDSQVRTSDGWASYRCGNKAAYEHNDKHFCKRHHPPTVEAKNARKQAAWNVKWDAEKAERNFVADASVEQKRRADLYPELLEGKAEAAIAAATGKPGEQT